jgi:branched-subunit amino acid transport protein
VSDFYIWIVILLLGLGTFCLRFSFIYLAGRVDLPAQMTRALRFVPAAVLSAIVLPALTYDHGGALNLSFRNPYLIAGLIAGVTAWRTRSMLTPLCVGMVAVWLLQALLR